VVRGSLLFLISFVAACESTPATEPAAPRVTQNPGSPRRELDRERARAETSAALPVLPTANNEGACPAGMALVDSMFCPDIERRCLQDEFNKPNKITICHRFAEEAGKCRSADRRQRFCIDRFEYPNREGARAPVMVDFHDAGAICQSEGKRLCWEGEWVAACEGPEKTPFPYGYRRNPQACNIDNPYIGPSLSKMYDSKPSVANAELERLDQGVPSGSKAGCKSGYDVFDQTGNVDEWVMLEQKRGEGGWAGLKGGGWGHVRNACRPVTTSHAPGFTYYFISFRCCADAKPSTDGGAAWVPPPLPPNVKTPETANRGFTPR
jgi:formylglycine-generating enzyme